MNDSTVKPVEKLESKPLYLGNYGYSTNELPPELKESQVDFIYDRLSEWIRYKNANSWAVNRLNILVDMLDEERPREWLQSQLKEISEKLKQ